MTDDEIQVANAVLAEAFGLAESYLPPKGDPRRDARARLIGQMMCIAGATVASKGGDAWGVDAMRNTVELMQRAVTELARQNN